jgi:hypothetical protein
MNRSAYPVPRYLLLAGVLSIIGLLPLTCWAGEWSEEIKLTEGTLETRDIRLGSDSHSNVHFVYREKDDLKRDNIWYVRVDSSGQISIPPKQIIDTDVWSRYGNLVVDSRDHVHIFWRKVGSTGYYEVWYTKLDTTGATLIAPKMVVAAKGTICDWLVPAVGVDLEDNLHLVWDQSDDNTEIHYTKLDNEGNILVEDVLLSWQGYDAREQALAVDAWGNVHVAWADGRGTPASGELVYSKLDNNGNFLVDNLSLTPEPDGRDSRRPDVMVDSEGNVHVCFVDTRELPGGDIWYTKLDNDGDFLIEPLNLASTTTNALNPEFAIDCWDTLHLMWSEESSLRIPDEIKYMKMASDGSIVDTLTLLPEPYGGYGDVVASPNGNVTVAWRDFRYGVDDQCIYFKYYDADCGCPDVSVYLTPDTTVVHRGGKLGFDILVRNNTGSSQAFEAWTDVILPNGKPYKSNPVLGPKMVPLQPRKWVIRHITQQVPGSAPLGDYVYMGKIGAWPDSLIDQDQFEFTVVEAARMRTESSAIAKTMKDWAVIGGDDW